LIPAYLKTIYKNDPYFKNTKTVFTVYSLASYASFPKSSYDKAHLPFNLFNGNGCEGDKLNFLKAGLAFADVITTIGNKADKGIVLCPHDEMEKFLHTRKASIIKMDGENGSHQGILAQKLIDIYRDLIKSN
jgi:starch synthase